MRYLFHPDAEAEFNDAIDYYEKREVGLGFDLALEVHAAIRRAVSYPEAWPMVHGDIRRSLVRRFPYGILYAVGGDEIHVVAVMHLHRRPGYWKSRME